MQTIIRFERLTRRSCSKSLVRILIDGDIYTFENSDKIERQLIRLLSGGPSPTVDVPADIVQLKQQRGYTE